MERTASPQPESQLTDVLLRELYDELGSVWKVAEFTGLAGQTVHRRLRRQGVTFKNPPITDEERHIIRAYYNSRADLPRGEFNLDRLAYELGRSKHLVCRVARESGLTDRNRQVSPATRATAKTFFIAWHEANEHPRGMLGKQHTAATKATIKDFNEKYWTSITDDQREARADAFRRTTKNSGWKPAVTGYSNARRGHRQDIDLYVRSSWEANYARFLNARVTDPADPLQRWEYEPDTFWFDNIKRGVRSYLPDFKLFETGRDPYYVEVKGYMDAKSKTKLARMKRYFPEVEVELVDSAAYRRLEKLVGNLLPNWEKPSDVK